MDAMLWCQIEAMDASVLQHLIQMRLRCARAILGHFTAAALYVPISKKMNKYLLNK